VNLSKITILFNTLLFSLLGIICVYRITSIIIKTTHRSTIYKMSATRDTPTCSLVGPLLTDLYQLTMAYGYWKAGKHNENSTFDVFFRKNPFKGEFCLYAGSDEILRYIKSFKFTESDIQYLKGPLGNKEEEFWQWLGALDCSQVKVYCMNQGEIVFPRVPIVTVEGPLGIVQLLETTILNLTNFACLVTTNARRIRNAAELETKPRLRPKEKIRPVQMLEFGLRRAQGPDGGYSASKYSVIGGFDATSNVIVGKMDGIRIIGTTAHSFITSFFGVENFSEIKPIMIARKGTGEPVEFNSLVLSAQATVAKVFGKQNNQGELAAFASFAAAFPDRFIALIDTFNSLKSGIVNFFIVGLALVEVGYAPIGVRLDSGDLAKLSIECRKMLIAMDAALSRSESPIFSDCGITVSNDINEDSIVKMVNEGHEIDIFAVGTNLVTCQKQPALGCVYKLVEINGTSRIKLSEDAEKTTIPSKKRVYRLYGSENQPLLDLITRASEPVPVAGQKILCRDPSDETKRMLVTPSRVQPLLRLLWKGKAAAATCAEEAIEGEVGHTPDITESKANCERAFRSMPRAITRTLNPTPYRVCLSSDMYDHLHKMIMDNTPIEELN